MWPCSSNCGLAGRSASLETSLLVKNIVYRVSLAIAREVSSLSRLCFDHNVLIQLFDVDSMVFYESFLCPTHFIGYHHKI